MKRFRLFLALLVLVSSCADRNKVIENPISKTFESVLVHKVEMTDSMTIVHAAVVGNNGWFRMQGDANGEYYLQSVENGQKYKYLGSDNFEMNKKYKFNSKNVAVNMTLKFEPVAKDDRVVDMILDGDESLNVRGLELQNRKCKPYTCHVSAEVEGDTKNVLICRYEDFDDGMRNVIKKAWFVPVVDGKFEIDLPTSGDDFYTMVALEEYLSGSVWLCEFIALKGDLTIKCCFKYPNVKREVSGVDNILIAELNSRGRNAMAEYEKTLEKLEADGFYKSDYAKEIYHLAEAEKDRDKQLALYNKAQTLPDSLRYCPEYYAVLSKRTAAENNLMLQMLDEAEANPSIGYLEMVERGYSKSHYEFYGDNYNLIRDRADQVAQLYVEKFPNNNKVKRLALQIEAGKIKVGSEYIDFEANDIEGQMFRFSDMIKGSRIVVLDLWASWCGPCRRAAMRNIPIYDKYKDKGMCVVSVAREYDNLDDVKAAVKKDGYTWPVLIELNDRINLWKQYNAGDSGGQMFVIDPSTKKILAIAPSTDEIEALVKQYCE